MITLLEFKVQRKVGEKYEDYIDQTSILTGFTPEQVAEQTADVHAMVAAIDPKKLPKATPDDYYVITLKGHAHDGGKQTPEIPFIPAPVQTTYEGVIQVQEHGMKWTTKKARAHLEKKKAKAKSK